MSLKLKHGLLLLGLLLFSSIIYGINYGADSFYCDEDNILMVQNPGIFSKGRWYCSHIEDAISGTSPTFYNINVTNKIYNDVPHMYGLASKTFTVPVINRWYNISFNRSISIVEFMEFLPDNKTIIIPEEGDYLIQFGVSVTDNSASPSSTVAVRVVKNGVELMGSYKEFEPTKQSSHQWLSVTFYVEDLVIGDQLQMQYIANDVDVTVSAEDLWAKTKFTAYGYINKEHD